VSAVADKYHILQDLGVEVISMSVDSVFVHKMWNDHELTKMVDGGVPFHMGSDAAGNVGRIYGVYDENAGVELRGRFIIDPDGVIQAMEVMTPPVGRRLAETIRQVQAFQTVRASKGTEATPAGWNPGQPTLKPGPDLVGNVWKVWKPSMDPLPGRIPGTGSSAALTMVRD
jgi:alkyl hydroperoxide reductase subunit AhpC